ncbi:MAG: hypothetical protein QOJ67_1348, partial [Acidimicrobiaceae bacterium]
MGSAEVSPQVLGPLGAAVLVAAQSGEDVQAAAA